MRKYNFTVSPIKQFFRKNGFYCALAVAIIGLGVSAYTAIGKASDILTPEPLGTVSETPAQHTVSYTEITSSDVKSEVSSEASQVSEEKETLKYPTCFMLPVEGRIYNEYSDGEMVFNNTLEDWRAHNAVDFQAKEGTPVKAVADGIVESIDYDESYGYVVTVNHGGKLRAKYCNLQREVFVEEGAKIDMGETLGGVGNGSYMECKDGAHLHFEMYKNDRAVDPLAILGVRE